MCPLINEANKQTIKEQSQKRSLYFSKTINLEVMKLISYELK